jgi:uncharacterized membrane protein YccC
MDIRTILHHHRPQLALAFRVVIAAVLALAFALLLKLRLPLWAVLTAVIVTQLSVGRSLKATIDYLIGTVSGAVYGGAVGVLVPHTDEFSLLGALALTVAPLAFVAAVNASFAAAPVTGILVFLIPDIIHASPLASATDRLLEVALGGVTGLVVSLLVFPSSARRLFAVGSARVLDQMAQALDVMLGNASRSADPDALARLYNQIHQDITHLSAASAEAEHERSARLTAGPATGPLLRTLVRLRHDLVMIGRTIDEPLPESLAERLDVPLRQAGTSFAHYLRACGDALLAHREPPALTTVESALASYAAKVGAVRHEGLTRPLSIDAAERFFAVGFAFDQMHRHVEDLGRCVSEWR